MPNNDQRKEQFTRVYDQFFFEPQTMKQLSVRVGIDRANICWYCRDMRRKGKISALKKGICPITKHRATFWTTNPDLFPKQGIQLDLFGNENVGLC